MNLNEGLVATTRPAVGAILCPKSILQKSTKTGYLYFQLFLNLITILNPDQLSIVRKTACTFTYQNMQIV